MIGFFKRLVCRIKGHHWEPNTIVATDSGSVVLNWMPCSRCEKAKRKCWTDGCTGKPRWYDRDDDTWMCDETIRHPL